MSGHSKWATIKHQKGAADAKRGQLFTKLSREIIFAARAGGGNPEGNSRLRLAIQKAKDARMPGDNIERAIKKGEGNLEGQQMFEASYEGYGPGGAAVMVDIVSDNRNRAVQELRSAFTRAGGNLGETGSVAWMFEAKGIIGVQAEGKDIDDITMKAIDAGADDVSLQGEYIEICTKPAELESVRKGLEQAGVEVESAELAKVANTTISLDEHTAFGVLRMLDRLEEMDDVQNVYHNVDIPDAVMEKYQSEMK
ncbi:MAG: YebC/PmpR family DNA-binding transcriptional regulator [Dehalococcoidia bacterium]|nr:YebC/PmpR family DNA-binding transcriptional regulator [Dehalococcoidia bacterium]